jgi:hypothetical protein
MLEEFMGFWFSMTVIFLVKYHIAVREKLITYYGRITSSKVSNGTIPPFWHKSKLRP